MGSDHRWTPGHEPRHSCGLSSRDTAPNISLPLGNGNASREEMSEHKICQAQVKNYPQPCQLLQCSAGSCMEEGGWETLWSSTGCRAGWCGRGQGSAAGVKNNGVVSRCGVQTRSSWDWVCVEKAVSQHSPSASYSLQVLVHALCPHGLSLLPSSPFHSCTQASCHAEVTIHSLLPPLSHITFDLMMYQSTPLPPSQGESGEHCHSAAARDPSLLLPPHWQQNQSRAKLLISQSVINLVSTSLKVSFSFCSIKLT